MSRPFLALSCALALAAPVAAQPCEAPSTGLSTQAQVDDFDDFDCVTLGGDLFIFFSSGFGDPIVDLSGLSELTTVNGSLSLSLQPFGYPSEQLPDVSSLQLETVAGDLVISGADLTDFAGFPSLRTVGGTLELSGTPGLTSLGDIADFTTLGGIYASQVPTLTDISAAAGFTSFSGPLRFFNTGITDFDGFESLTSVAYLNISTNPDLTDLSGLANLVDLGQYIRINALAPGTDLSPLDGALAPDTLIKFSNNDQLGQLPQFVGMDLFDGELFLDNNSGLTSLDGLGTPDTLGRLFLKENEDLADLSALRDLRVVKDFVTISNNASLTSLDGLGSLVSVGLEAPALFNFFDSPAGPGLFLIADNASLTSLDGLSRLTAVDQLSVVRNPMLANVDGLAGLQTANRLDVDDNTLLANVDGLAGLSSVAEQLSLRSNPSLASCSCGLNSLLSSEAAPPTVAIFNNAEGCNSAQQVLDGFEAGSCPVLETPDLAGALSYGSCPEPPAALSAGRERCRVTASGTNLLEVGQRYTVFLRLDGPAGFSRVAFRGEIKPRAEQQAEQQLPLRTLRSDPTGAYSVTLLAEKGSVASPSAAAQDLGSLSLLKGGASLRATAPLAVYPNPTTSTAHLSFAVTEASRARLVVYDALGREVARPVDRTVEGIVEASLDASGLAPGLYVARLAVGERTETVRFSVAR